jgi:hypothetical protein
MDVSLIYPPLALEARYGRRKLGKVGGHLPPLGLLCLAAMLRQEGFSAGIIDGPAEKNNRHQDAGALLRRRSNRQVLETIRKRATIFHNYFLEQKPPCLIWIRYRPF